MRLRPPKIGLHHGVHATGALTTARIQDLDLPPQPNVHCKTTSPDTRPNKLNGRILQTAGECRSMDLCVLRPRAWVMAQIGIASLDSRARSAVLR
jgi:hypothetical protein